MDELLLREEWMKEAREMKIENLQAFVEKLIAQPHDYGTICRAIAAAGVAAAYAVEHSPSGGITGFQAGAVMWDLITGWDRSKEGKAIRMLDYEEMLYPQYEYKFRSISPRQWERLQKQAKENLVKDHQAVARVAEHWKSVAAGNIPFGYRVQEQ